MMTKGNNEVMFAPTRLYKDISSEKIYAGAPEELAPVFWVIAEKNRTILALDRS